EGHTDDLQERRGRLDTWRTLLLDGRMMVLSVCILHSSLEQDKNRSEEVIPRTGKLDDKMGYDILVKRQSVRPDRRTAFCQDRFFPMRAPSADPERSRR